MPPTTHISSFPGAILERGFWLYVWRVATPSGEMLYVGRTGDNSSPNAVPPYTRMSQHLNFLENQNALRKHLVGQNVHPELCSAFQLIAHGPIYPEVDKSTGDRAEWMLRHIPLRNIVGAMERQLACDLIAAGYNVLNTNETWLPVRAAFAKHFTNLNSTDAVR